MEDSNSNDSPCGSIAVSHWEKVPDGRMRELLPVEVLPTVLTRTSNPLIRRYGATFSQREKGVQRVVH
jgi:hypothetical protein